MKPPTALPIRLGHANSVRFVLNPMTNIDTSQNIEK
jgi:hypothetical protein